MNLESGFGNHRLADTVEFLANAARVSLAGITLGVNRTTHGRRKHTFQHFPRSKFATPRFSISEQDEHSEKVFAVMAHLR